MARVHRDLSPAQVIALIRQLTPAQMQIIALYLLIEDRVDRDDVIARIRQLVT
jgi:hypothetical protein